jgi:hypothetical protein
MPNPWMGQQWLGQAGLTCLGSVGGEHGGCCNFAVSQWSVVNSEWQFLAASMVNVAIAVPSLKRVCSWLALSATIDSTVQLSALLEYARPALVAQRWLGTCS